MDETQLEKQTKPVIRCFCLPAKGGLGSEDVIAYAIDDNDNIVSTHHCSNPGWAKKDILRESHFNDYLGRYPDGYTLEWSDVVPEGWTPSSQNYKKPWLVKRKKKHIKK